MATDEELYSMSDEELEKAFNDAKAQLDSPETEYEDTQESVEEAEEEVYSDQDEDAEVTDLEQPDEDSDDDTSSEDEEEDESNEDLESEEEDLDEDTDSDDEKLSEDAYESEVDEQPAQRRKYRANGKEYEFSDEEIFDKFGQVFGQAMNYTQKMQQIKPWRKTIDAIEQAELSHDDVNLAIDVLKGDKDAIAALLKRTGVDALELDVDNTKYQPKDYGRNDTELAIKEVFDDISKDPEYDTTYRILENEWDVKSRQKFVENPEMIRQLHIDVKNGMFNTIAPLADKLKTFDGGSKSDLDYYQLAAQQYFDQLAQDEARQASTTKVQAERNKVAEVKEASKKREATKTASKRRKAAAPTKKTAGAAKITDYLDESEEAYQDWYKTLEDSM